LYPGPEEHGAPTLAVIHVLTGPDAGAQIALGRGSTIIGRGPDSDVVLSDQLVSKRHVRLKVAAGIDLVDLGSANGVVVDGGLVTRLRIEQGETVQIGDTELRITVVETVAETGDEHRDGPVYFNRSPRVKDATPVRNSPRPRCRPRRTTSHFPGWQFSRRWA
jgi:S-DNA-T family DNA segregation ATPase FtsK/SpoIIIE